MVVENVLLLPWLGHDIEVCSLHVHVYVLLPVHILKLTVPVAARVFS